MIVSTKGVYLYRALAQNVKHIAIIDDDRLTLTLTEKLILNWLNGIKVTKFTNALTALESFENSPDTIPDLILLDINMPELSGWDFLNIASEKNLPITVCMFSSSIDEGDVIRAKTYQKVVAFITKPITKEKVLAVVQH
jgi:CheY-like chemotaxis protein